MMAFFLYTVIIAIEDVGYNGQDGALSEACFKYYWPTMRFGIEKYVA